MAPQPVLKDLLSFALHSLSPRRVGATLVWCLRKPSNAELNLMKPQIDLQSPSFSPSNGAERSILRHFLGQTDGATLLDPRGATIGTAAHLQYSEKSSQLIPQTKGTRHTSAKRFSYDFQNGLIITVSADGPVTVFSDGANIAELDIISAEKVANGLSEAVPSKAGDMLPDIYEEQCKKCGKHSIINELVIGGWREREEANCSVCGDVIASASCYMISAHVVKKLSAAEITK